MRYGDYAKFWTNSVRRVLVWGAGGHSQEVQQALRALGVHAIVRSNHEPDGEAFFTSTADIPGLQPLVDGVHIAIGDADLRDYWGRQFEQLGIPVLTIVHPRAWVAASAEIGAGVYVGPMAVVQPSEIEPLVIVNTHATVSHDCRVGRATHLAPGSILLGGVRVGEKATVFAGAVIAPCLQVGNNARVGAQALVRENAPAGYLVAGVPAQICRSRDDRGDSNVRPHNPAKYRPDRGAETKHPGARRN